MLKQLNYVVCEDHPQVILCKAMMTETAKLITFSE